MIDLIETDLPTPEPGQGLAFPERYLFLLCQK